MSEHEPLAPKEPGWVEIPLPSPAKQIPNFVSGKAWRKGKLIAFSTVERLPQRGLHYHVSCSVMGRAMPEHGQEMCRVFGIHVKPVFTGISFQAYQACHSG